jgi:hypothetical protein
MKYGQKVLSGVVLSLLSACAVLTPPAINVGETEAEVVAKLGQPTARIPDGSEHLLEYSRNPWGQAINMARFGSDGRLISYEQVLTIQKFATIKPGLSTKTDVLRTIGHPSETSYLPRLQLEVWTYPYKEGGVWNSLMHVHFDKTGVVKRMQNDQDLRFERDGIFGSFGR